MKPIKVDGYPVVRIPFMKKKINPPEWEVQLVNLERKLQPLSNVELQYASVEEKMWSNARGEILTALLWTVKWKWFSSWQLPRSKPYPQSKERGEFFLAILELCIQVHAMDSSGQYCNAVEWFSEILWEEYFRRDKEFEDAGGKAAALKEFRKEIALLRNEQNPYIARRRPHLERLIEMALTLGDRQWKQKYLFGQKPKVKGQYHETLGFCNSYASWLTRLDGVQHGLTRIEGDRFIRYGANGRDKSLVLYRPSLERTPLQMSSPETLFS